LIVSIEKKAGGNQGGFLALQSIVGQHRASWMLLLAAVRGYFRTLPAKIPFDYNFDAKVPILPNARFGAN
jgi:hypothetical protein